ncbi:GNAT family protein [Fulvivirgaceae bacterium BMA10]|uniref:GNAT family protein n=1 Tax=Splendidivirga corallicola TaxID=3051826 RepID=A0ABT8KPM3_9BACT|nr:GNAT family protein [Fulvivirgaceae bacterium BMA10]
MNKYSLKPIAPVDFENIVSWLSSPEDMVKICGNTFQYPLTESVFTEYFVEQAGTERNRLCFKWTEEGSEHAEGMISYTRIDWKNDFGHIGLVAIDPALRSKGIGNAMFQSCLTLGFGELGFNRIDLVVLESNKNAIRFYEKLGFTKEGLVREIIKVDGQYKSWFTMSLLKREWEARSG